MKLPIIDENNFIQTIKLQENPFFENYYACYSSWLGGVIKNPHLMLLPIDDHIVHRGDGVFEGIKAVNRFVYLMEEHLQRLLNSAEKISLDLPFDINEIKEIILETLRIANQNNAMIRVFISRGPGNFSVNPYDSVASQLYVMITAMTMPSPEKYTQGVSIGKSEIPNKPSWLSRVKSCNYLANVLMKKEAVDRGLDFVIGIDEDGMITEGPTENIMIINQQNKIIHPSFDHILKGTTLVRTCELAHENGIETEAKPISFEDLLSASEVIITGTTANILPVVKFEHAIIGNGKPGKIAKKLNELLILDSEQGIHRTPF